MISEPMIPDSAGAARERADRWDRQARHFESKVHFNRLCGLEVTTWTDQPIARWRDRSLADTCGTSATSRRPTPT